MKARPILMNGEMVRACLREIEQPGTGKTQTRRVVKPYPFTGEYHDNVPPCPFGEEGSLLWVRETWCCVYPLTGEKCEDGPCYRSTDLGECGANWCLRWKPSIHMPRWASRLTLQITDIRVERVQEISDKDILAEGIESLPLYQPVKWISQAEFNRNLFADLWDSLNKGRGFGWDENPWVWVIYFKPILKNVDSLI